MARIFISGPAHVIADDPREGEILDDPETLQSLHGMRSAEKVRDVLTLSSELDEVVVGGGRLRFVYSAEENELRISTAYDVSRELTPDESRELIEATFEQWSDGAGSGQFGNHAFHVLSTTLGMAIQNQGEDIEDYGNIFLNAWPDVEERDIFVEYSPDASSDDEMLQELVALVEAGDADAMTQLAHFYRAGESVEEDLQQALRLFQSAAKLENPEAMVFGGFMLQQGEGCEVDHEAAFELFEQAVDLGFTTGMHALGECYAEGYGVPVDGPRSVELYRQGAELGDPACMAELGDCLEFGKGIEIDLEQALECYQASSDAGFDPVDPALQRVKEQLGRT